MNLNFLTPTRPHEPAVSLKSSSFDKIVQYCLVAMVALVPLLILPFTSDFLEFNKQAFIFLAVIVMLGAFVVKVLATRSAVWIKTSLDYAVIGYLLVYLISSLMSLDKASSFLGYYGRFTGSFMSVFSLVVLYFLIVNNVRNEKVFRKITQWLTFGSFAVIAYALLQILGIKLLSFITATSFNPIGSMVALNIFTALFVIFYQWQLFALNGGRAMRIALSIFSVLGLVLMFLINAFAGWLVLTIGLVVFLAVGMMLTTSHQSGETWFWKPLLILVVAILFLAFRFLPQSINPRNIVQIENLPIEIQLSNSTTWNLVGNSMRSGMQEAMIGSGPGTVGIAFGQIKPEALNKTIVWSVNFDRGSTEVANILIETGILGFLAFELTAILFLFYSLFFLLKKSHPGRHYAFGFFLLWVALYVAHFFYFFNTTFYFLYWVSLGMFMAVTHWREDGEEVSTLSFASSPRSTLTWMFASLILLAVLLVGGFFQAVVYAAELSYVSGLKTLNETKPDFAKATDQFARAVNLNQYRDVYLQAYGQSLIFLASEEAAKPEPDLDKIRSWVSNLIAAGQQATVISPNKASNWSVLAQFYTSIRPLAIEGTNEAVIKAWEAAAAKDELNPAILIQLAGAYSIASETIDPSIAGSGADSDGDGLSDSKEQALGSDPAKPDSNDNGTPDGEEVQSGFNPAGVGRLTAAQLRQFVKLDTKLLKQAEDTLIKAIALKDDLPESRLELARVYEKGGKLAEARKALDDAVKLFPANADVRFEQGRIAYNQKNYTEAEKIFLEVITIDPKHANAHYSLGLVYEQKGDLVKALASYEKTREISGPNVELEQKINSLKSQ